MDRARLYVSIEQAAFVLPVTSLGQLCMLMCLGGFCEGNSCRETKLCCPGRDSSCVVQKAQQNAIVEDPTDKPCYCDHACLKLGDCCPDFKDTCGDSDSGHTSNPGSALKSEFGTTSHPDCSHFIDFSSVPALGWDS
ncbi:hypothetical protein EVAR_58563_1 [Eumeta japonica]|uniref:SMB domain-containing protein n=1 Tax=Eumeta variegata TaxID=151549 RepID=A0A4C1YIW9_EUMVA|nr:hypothetical protein EVAR_58563_1 [Eumeta japonica]